MSVFRQHSLSDNKRKQRFEDEVNVMSVDERLKELGITLPQPAAPVAAYVPWVISGDLLFVSGQLPLRDGTLACSGLLGESVGIKEGYEAARLCALNCIAQASAALKGDLQRIARVVKLTGFVAATADFTDHPRVINGASELMEQVFGEAGRHARAAVGCASLPLGASVEVEAVFQLGSCLNK